ncbi:uncharacterized protein LOC122795584 [Protopterus annectens]|uniref:uncharacterized protein LOC122795584 n=1 Tax=Protopterus annectens TaxID=7888 RepID=UPI001CFB0DA7|nr:uncharacterized protein LOC122795584 [Protopterus annectens]
MSAVNQIPCHPMQERVPACVKDVTVVQLSVGGKTVASSWRNPFQGVSQEQKNYPLNQSCNGDTVLKEMVTEEPHTTFSETHLNSTWATTCINPLTLSGQDTADAKPMNWDNSSATADCGLRLLSETIGATLATPLHHDSVFIKYEQQDTHPQDNGSNPHICHICQNCQMLKEELDSVKEEIQALKASPLFGLGTAKLQELSGAFNTIFQIMQIPITASPTLPDSPGCKSVQENTSAANEKHVTDSVWLDAPIHDAQKETAWCEPKNTADLLVTESVCSTEPLSSVINDCRVNPPLKVSESAWPGTNTHDAIQQAPWTKPRTTSNLLITESVCCNEPPPSINNNSSGDPTLKVHVFDKPNQPTQMTAVPKVQNPHAQGNLPQSRCPASIITLTKRHRLKSCSAVKAKNSVLRPLVAYPGDGNVKTTVLVDGVQLHSILNDTSMQPQEARPLFLLNGLIDLVFTTGELASSNGLGRRNNSKANPGSNRPLDNIRVDAVKAFLKATCNENGWTYPTTKEFNKKFTNKIGNARLKTKKIQRNLMFKKS